MAIATSPTKRREPTPAKYSSGKPRVKMEKGDGGPAQPSRKGVCFICGLNERGDTFTAQTDLAGVARAIHTPTVIGYNADTVRNAGCLKAFESQVEAGQRQILRERQEDLALAALRREESKRAPCDDIGPKTLAAIDRIQQKRPSSPTIQREFFTCSEPECKRFYDNASDRDLHLQSHKKVESDADCPSCPWQQRPDTKNRPLALGAHQRAKHPND